ncbi:hypothetical protein COT30_01225 [Candidatus Micrarchaeota archaeon CG08_land_8_20_14_0_20_49_17]|nr:MAG: hypothetical protein COT30_01225 [Candidatus Micrarchaeota archaeon CG08_land_8_20_14_0_20_49_17]
MLQQQHSIGDNSRRAMLQQQHSIGDNSRRDFRQLAKSQQAIAGNRRRAMLHRAEGESYAPAGAFNQKHSIDHQGRFNSATPR